MLDGDLILCATFIEIMLGKGGNWYSEHSCTDIH